MQQFSTSPVEMLKSFLRNRSLIYQMSKREVLGRYRGSLFGLLWSFFNPVLMLAVYTFVFSVIFKGRWPGVTDNLEFAGILFAGLIVYSLFSECVSRSPTLMIANVNFVKKVVFPLEILPWIAMGASVFHASISIMVLIGFMFALHSELHLTILLLPFVLFPLLVLTIGIAWFLASLGTFVRDISQGIRLLMMAMLFMSPIFYPASSFPASYKVFFYLNPLTFIIEQARAVLLWGEMPDWQGLGIYLVVSCIVAWLGFSWFQKTRKGFADVL